MPPKSPIAAPIETGRPPAPPAQAALGRSGGSSRSLLRALPHLLKQASSEWNGDNAPRLGAAVAFYTLLSLAPIMVLAVTVAVVVYGHSSAQGRLLEEIQGIAGQDVARAIKEVIARGYQPRTGLIATSLGLAVLVFGTSSVFVELHDAMNTIWEVPPPQDRNSLATVVRLIRDRIYSFATVLCVGFLLLVFLALTAWIAAARIAAPPILTFITSYLVTAVLFAALYKTVPDVRLKWRDVAPGAAIASLLFVIGRQFLWLYFARSSFGSAYSAAGAPIVVLLWLYYSAQLLFWGAEFSKVYAKTMGSHAGA